MSFFSSLANLFKGPQAVTPAANTRLTRAEYAEAYLQALAKQYPQASFTLNEDLSISSDFDGNQVKHYIDNAYLAYEAEPGKLQDVITQYLAAASHLYDKKDDTILNNIVPIIKPAGYGEQMTMVGNEAVKVQLVTEPYNDELVIAYAEDSEHAISYLSEKRLEHLHISKESLREIALGYLPNVLGNIERHDAGEGFYMITAGGVYEVSLILIDSMWTHENFAVDGDIVIAISNRDILFVTGSNNGEAIEKMRAMATEYYNTGNYAVSPFLFKWNGERFVRFHY